MKVTEEQMVIAVDQLISKGITPEFADEVQGVVERATRMAVLRGVGLREARLIGILVYVTSTRL